MSVFSVLLELFVLEEKFLGWMWHYLDLVIMSLKPAKQKQSFRQS